MEMNWRARGRTSLIYMSRASDCVIVIVQMAQNSLVHKRINLPKWDCRRQMLIALRSRNDKRIWIRVPITSQMWRSCTNSTEIDHLPLPYRNNHVDCACVRWNVLSLGAFIRKWRYFVCAVTQRDFFKAWLRCGWVHTKNSEQ